MASNLIKKIETHFKQKARPDKAAFFPKFFKAFPGGYGEGDKFYGVTMPDCHDLVKDFYPDCELSDLPDLLKHPYHEMRMVGFLLLVQFYKKFKQKELKTACIDLYLDHLDFANNWDLVDVPCTKLTGQYTFDYKRKDILINLSKSNHLWRERVAVVSTLYWIKKGSFDLTLQFSADFLKHPHDLMHKACGWMLREVGKKDVFILCDFLDEFYQEMPRTMLRYAIEKLDEELRQAYLKGTRP